MSQASLLIISQESSFARLISERFPRVTMQHAGEWHEALGALRRSPWSAVVLDVDGADAPLEFLRMVRMLAPITPVLVLTRKLPAELINGAHAQRMELLAKPVDQTALLDFAERSLVSSRGLQTQQVQAWVKVLVKRCELNPFEADLFNHVLGHETREEVVRRWQSTEPRMHAHLLSLLRKCDVRSVDSLAKRVMIQAVRMRMDPNVAFEPIGDADQDDEPALRAG
jgi:hypothetical protein